MRSRQSSSAHSIKFTAAIVALLLSTLFPAAGATEVDIAYELNQVSLNLRRLTLTRELEALSGQLVSLTRHALAGQEPAFDMLNDTIIEMQKKWDKLRNDTDKNLGIASTKLADDMTAYEKKWMRVKRNAQVVISNKNALIFNRTTSTALSKSLQELQRELDFLVDVLLEKHLPADQVSTAEKQNLRAERIGRNLEKTLLLGDDAQKSVDILNMEANTFERVLLGMREGSIELKISRIRDNDAIPILKKIDVLFVDIHKSIRIIFNNGPSTFSAKESFRNINEESPSLSEMLASLFEQFESLAAQHITKAIESKATNS